MAKTVQEYLSLVTSEHASKTNFIAFLTALLQPFCDIQVVLESMQEKYDLDVAVGEQLDVIGQWVGRSRYLSVPLTGVYFSFDDAALGFDLGTWKGPFDPVSGLVALPDDTYRVLLKAVIAANRWDGTIREAYEIWDIVFAAQGFTLVIQDNGDMSMTIGLLYPTATPPNAVFLALLTGGYIALRPSGVRIREYVTPSVPGGPFFGFDAQNSSVAGFDTGSWSQQI